MSLAKLTSLSTQTLSLLLERQRLQSLPQFQSQSGSTSNLHLPQITRNLNQLRAGILELEVTDPNRGGETAGLLRNQHARMRAMVGGEEETNSLGIQSLGSPIPVVSHPPTPSPARRQSEPVYSPYTDDPEAGAPYDPDMMLQTQKRTMDDQDVHLENLSHSIGRQHGISMAIGSEIEEHHGLLEQLDTEVDNTHNRLTGARKRLDRVAKGVKGNGSVVTIAALILVLLILIIVFKT
ncbi:hypothetical protein FIBSPDRAFT_874452 [Athelia psychrophila]|uniref:t-SNARE coiled-coil homology domain-containing protein n=1 Tax=Athelia psychrophila TaxID=1759441 RepID=A0A165XGL7_9AGAM|nr:hypothetical protein FIBSPDRAFT_874452 [Fibularhizoctonia sp. CBS 109695]